MLTTLPASSSIGRKQWCRYSASSVVGGDGMSWEAPDFVEVKMDAEINSYQDDFGGEQDDRF